MNTDLLIAEANAQLRADYERLFGELGVEVQTAANGLECWTKLQECSPEALVLDMEMPWGGGDGVLARLREDSDVTIKPSIFIAGLDSPILLSRRYGIAVGNCFQKPLRSIALLEFVCAAGQRWSKDFCVVESGSTNIVRSNV